MNLQKTWWRRADSTYRGVWVQITSLGARVVPGGLHFRGGFEMPLLYLGRDLGAEHCGYGDEPVSGWRVAFGVAITASTNICRTGTLIQLRLLLCA
jgi:hypothetical protein